MEPKLIDSHAHLSDPSLLGQVEEVLARARQAGVERIISIATTTQDAETVRGLAARYPAMISAAAGIHPHQAGTTTDEHIAALEDIFAGDDVVALGEMGLDYHYDFSPVAVQKRVFAAQLRMAQPHDKPVIIHSREAVADTVALLRDEGFGGRRVVFHCFTGTAAEAGLIADNGWRISFTGVVTFPKSDELQAIARDYPADQLMVETDSPYLSPMPVRGKRPNEPAFVAHTARFLADLRGEPWEAFAARVRENTQSFFGLPI